MNAEPFAVAGFVAVALIAYAILGLIVPFLRTASFPTSTRHGKDDTVQIVVTTPSGRDITLPLRPDNEDSIRDFLRQADAATGA